MDEPVPQVSLNFIGNSENQANFARRQGRSFFCHVLLISAKRSFHAGEWKKNRRKREIREIASRDVWESPK